MSACPQTHGSVRARWSAIQLLFWGPFRDHTLCALANDLRVCVRQAPTQVFRVLHASWGNVLPLLTGGRVVAGSNPVSPTSERCCELVVCSSGCVVACVTRGRFCR
jgi:hypothetical protein